MTLGELQALLESIIESNGPQIKDAPIYFADTFGWIQVTHAKITEMHWTAGPEFKALTIQ